MSGIKNVFTFCSYIPEEIIMAFGFNPVRVMGNGRPISKANGFLPTNVCSFARNCYDYIAENEEQTFGYIFANSCHAMESLYEVIRESMNRKNCYILNVPRDCSMLSVEYFTEELEGLIEFFEKLLALPFEESKLIESINKVNQKRILRKNIEDLIANKELYLCSSEYMNLVNLYHSDTEKFLTEETHKLDNKCYNFNGPRIMLSGSVCAPFDLGSLVEDCGGKVVLYDTCNGIRQTTSIIETDTDGDILKAVAKSYLSKPVCARYNDINQKVEEIEAYIEKYSIDAVIFSAMKFCTDQSYGIISVTDKLKEKGIPFLFLDSEYLKNCSGQVLTRVQTFLEQM